MPHGSYGGSIANVMRRRGLRIALALLLVTLVPFAMKQYAVQEYFVALIVLILVYVPVLLVLVAFVLMQEGARRALRGLNTSLTHLTVWSQLHLRASRLRAKL